MIDLPLILKETTLKFILVSRDFKMIIQMTLLILIKNMLIKLSDCVYWQFCLVSVFQRMKCFPGHYIGSFLKNYSLLGTSVQKVSLVFLLSSTVPAFLPIFPVTRKNHKLLFQVFIFLRNPASLCYCWSWYVSAHASAAQSCYCNNFAVFFMKL